VAYFQTSSFFIRLYTGMYETVCVFNNTKCRRHRELFPAVLISNVLDEGTTKVKIINLVLIMRAVTPRLVKERRSTYIRPQDY
jgi:hypothetical protein